MPSGALREGVEEPNRTSRILGPTRSRQESMVRRIVQEAGEWSDLERSDVPATRNPSK